VRPGVESAIEREDDIAAHGGARDTTIAFSSRFVVLAASLGIQSTLAWLLMPEGRGSYAVCLLFATLLTTVFTIGVDRGGQYFASSGRMPLAESVRTTLVALLLGSLLAVAVGRALMEIDLPLFTKADRSSFLVALGIVPVVAFHNALIMLLVGLRRFAWMAAVAIWNILVQLAATLILVAGLRLGVSGALLAIILAGAVSIPIALFFLARLGGFAKCRLTASGFRSIISYGLRCFVAKLSNMVHFRLGTAVLAFFVAPSMIGIFAGASGLVTRVLLVPSAIEQALYSRVTGDARGRPELVAQAARVTAIAVGGLLIVIVALAGPIVRVLLSPRFAASTPLVWIIAPGVFLRSATKVLMPYFMGTDRPAICSWAVGTGLLVNLVALLVLIPALGLAGAAWAMTLGYLSSSLILALAFRRVSGQPPLDTWLPRRGDFTFLRESMRAVVHRSGDDRLETRGRSPGSGKTGEQR
jgi:O-antigen/teichoic acid export membrane protein